MSMHYLNCGIRGCRQENDLTLCAVCEQLVCQRHAATVAGEVVCQMCAPATPAPAARPGQQELFT